MQRLIHERGRLAELKSARGGIDRLVNDVYALLRVDPDETVDDLIAAGCADGAFDRVALLRAVQAWASGPAPEQPKSKLLAEWLAGADGARVEQLPPYRLLFPPRSGKPPQGPRPQT